LSDEQRAVAHAGFRDALLYQEQKSIDATLNDLEHTLHRNTSVTGATNAARQFNGLLNIFTTNFTSSSGTTLTEDIFGDLMQLFQVNDADIRPTAVFVNNWLKRTISQYSTRVTRYVDAAAKVQINTIEEHDSDFGTVRVYYSRDQLRSTTRTGQGNSIVILDPNFFEVGFLQPLTSELLERDGLRTRFQISAMATLIYRTERAGGGGQGYVAYLPTAT
jgi:uncharacterized protein DUF5309